jgi:hypothetical protein
VPITHHVKPDNVSNFSYPEQLSQTLDQYVSHSSEYFTEESVFIFVPGNYSLLSSIMLANVTNITLRGSGEDARIITTRYPIIVNNVTGLTIEMLTFHQLQGDSYCLFKPATLKIFNSRMIVISSCTFRGSDRTPLLTQHSNISILWSLFEGNKGGAVHASSSSNLHLSGNNFTRNTAGACHERGGAIFVDGTMLLLSGNNYFGHNNAGSSGGAIDCLYCTLHMTGKSVFESNRCQDNLHYGSKSHGGAISMSNGKLIISGSAIFSNNRAVDGGGVYLFHSNAVIGGQIVHFSNNSAEIGGGLRLLTTSVKANARSLEFIGNTATSFGGGLASGDVKRGRPLALSRRVIEISGRFVQNKARYGGAAYLGKERHVKLVNISITESNGSALYISESNVTFAGTTVISRNSGSFGGGTECIDSLLTFKDAANYQANSAEKGGAISVIQSAIAIHGTLQFALNVAEEGGAVHAIGSSISFSDYSAANFSTNLAGNGAAMYLSAATLTLGATKLEFHNNSADGYGGVIFHKDTPNTLQCSFMDNSETADRFLSLPYCFLQRQDFIVTGSIISSNNSATQGGSFLYGGLLDRCRPYKENVNTEYALMTNEYLLSQMELSSEAYELCFCNHSRAYHSREKCLGSKNIVVQRGQKFTLSLIALAQGRSFIPTMVSAVPRNSNLGALQSNQKIIHGCSNLTYSLRSAGTQSELILLPNGPCQDTGLALVSINVTFLPCPVGFIQIRDGCVCEERLKNYRVQCRIDRDIQFIKSNSSNFWIGVLQAENGGNSGGIILCGSCPADYCIPHAVVVTPSNMDTQCDMNHSGILCGQCVSGYSLTLGASHCEVCSNNYLLLLLAFAVAGVALVALLTFLKLTVATGTLNGIILYVNIIQVNRNLFFPRNEVSVLGVFVAWLNLDLGIKTCFYNGMTAYVQTWLQFLFPAYVWILISIIISSAHYSVILSTVIGSNPVSVLATLLLMSYTKILRIVTDVYSFEDLDYPHGETVRVWLKDGNVPYLSTKHLLLTVVTSLVVVTFFLPYTFVLMVGHKLYRFTGRKWFRWFRRVFPLLESYYAPYQLRARYWTGFLLLMRCVLYIIFSFNSLGGERKSMLAITLTFTALGILGSGRIYKRTADNIMETFVYFNLVVLSAATLAEYRSPALVSFLVGTVFAITIGYVAHQFYLLYISNTSAWHKVRAVVFTFCSRRFQTSTRPNAVDIHHTKTSHDPHKITTKSVVELREPLLESDS